MRHAGLIRALGILLVAVVALSIGGHATIEAGQPVPLVSSPAVEGAFGGQEAEFPVAHPIIQRTSKETARVWLKLQEKIPFSFPNETTLDEVLKYVRQSTVEKDVYPDGLPIYLNPVGLAEAEKTPSSLITLDLKGIPLATSLKLALDQLGLAFWIHPDGLIVITNKESEDVPIEAEGAILEELKSLRREVQQLRLEFRYSQGIHPGGSGMYSGPLPSLPDAKPNGSMGSKGGMM